MEVAYSDDKATKAHRLFSLLQAPPFSLPSGLELGKKITRVTFSRYIFCAKGQWPLIYRLRNSTFYGCILICVAPRSWCHEVKYTLRWSSKRLNIESLSVYQTHFDLTLTLNTLDIRAFSENNCSYDLTGSCHEHLDHLVEAANIRCFRVYWFPSFCPLWFALSPS